MWWLALIIVFLLMAIYFAYVRSIQSIINERVAMAEEAAGRMHDQLREEGVREPEGDAEPAQIPFLAILPDMSLHVAVLEQDVYSATVPLVPRKLSTVGATEPTPDPTAAPSIAQSSRFVPAADPNTTSSGPLSTCGPVATSTSIAMPQHSAQQPHSVSGRLRQFGLMALPSLRRAELEDIPDSLVWSVAVIDAAHAALPTRLTSSTSTSSRSGWLTGASRSFRVHGSSASRALSRGSSLRRGASTRSAAGDTSGLGRSASIPMQALARSGDLPHPPPFTAPVPPPFHASAPLRAGSPALQPADLGGSGGWVMLDPPAPARDDGSGALRQEPQLTKPAKPARSKSLRKGRSFRSAGGDGYERLAGVQEGVEGTVHAPV
eukprot:jgi/Ulvmu1/5555/UM023_0091.1